MAKDSREEERGGVCAPSFPEPLSDKPESSAQLGGAAVLPGQVSGRRQGQWAQSLHGVVAGGKGKGLATCRALGAQAKPQGRACATGLAHTPERPLPAGACVLQGGSERLPAGPPIHTEGLHLFLRQSCILILDVSPEAYFS